MLIVLGAGWKPPFVCVVLSADESKVTFAASSVLIPAAINQNKLLHCYFCGILQIHKNTFMGFEKLDIWKSSGSRTVRKSHVLSVRKILLSLKYGRNFPAQPTKVLLNHFSARSQKCEKWLLASSCLFALSSVRMEQLGSHWTDFPEIRYLRIFRKKKKCSENSNFITIGQK